MDIPGHGYTNWQDSIHIPLHHDASTVTAPEPLGAVFREGIGYGLTLHETAALPAWSPIFESLVKEAVRKQVRHEEDQIRAWLAALIAHPEGRKIVEDML